MPTEEFCVGLSLMDFTFVPGIDEIDLDQIKGEDQELVYIDSFRDVVITDHLGEGRRE